MAATTTTASSGTIHDSPWADLSKQDDDDERPRVLEETDAFGHPRSKPTASRTSTRTSPDDDNGCAVAMMNILVHIIWVTDVLIGLALLTDDLLVGGVRPHTAVTVSWIIVAVTTLLRGITLGCGLSTARNCSRCGLCCSVLLSPVLALESLILSVLSVVYRQTVLDFLRQHPSARLLHYLQTHYHLVWIFLLVASLIQCIEWQILVQYYRRQRELSWERELGLQRDGPLASPSPRRGRPWWWQQQESPNDLQASLLGNPSWVTSNARGYHEQTGVSSNARGNNNNNNSRRWWRWWPGHNDNYDEDIRDGGSVDFASVQEEWASRTEEDPFWWSREDTDQPDDALWADDNEEQQRAEHP